MSTVPIGTLANLPLVIDELGFDGWRLLQDFGLDPDSFVRPLEPVPIAVCGELLRRAVAYTRCDELPMRLGAKARMENLGPLRFLIDSSSRVRPAVNALIRFRRIWFPGFQIALLEQRGAASMAIHFAGSFPGHQELRTSYLTAMVRHLDLILGARFPLRQLHFSRAAPADPRPYRRHFGLAPVFGQARDATFFDAALLDRKRTPQLDTDMNQFLRRQLVVMESALGLDFAEQVADLIGTLLIGGECNAEKVAEVLGVHRLTLYRRLRAQGTTFEALLDTRRATLAREMLQRNTITVAEIADALGYRVPANFTRAFRRWEGMSPVAWRKHHLRRPRKRSARR